MKELPNMASTAAAALHLYKTCYVRINSYQNLNWVLFHGFIPSLWFQALHHIILVIMYVYTILQKQLPHSSTLPMSYMCRVTPEPFIFPLAMGFFCIWHKLCHWVLCFLFTGFADHPLSPCCTDKKDSRIQLCGNTDSEGRALYKVCKEPSQRVIFDGIHPTDAAWKAAIHLYSSVSGYTRCGAKLNTWISQRQRV
jgi:hypothetical protein